MAVGVEGGHDCLVSEETFAEHCQDQPIARLLANSLALTLETLNLSAEGQYLGP
jgi:hypothetical protein